MSSPCRRSIGCESDPADDLGRNVYLWTLIRLVDVWVDEGNECGPVAHEQIVRVCRHGRVPLTHLLRLPLAMSASTVAGSRGGSSAAWRGEGRLKAACSDLDSGSVLAPLMEKLMETGHVEEFVEQVRVGVMVNGSITRHS